MNFNHFERFWKVLSKALACWSQQVPNHIPIQALSWCTILESWTQVLCRAQHDFSQKTVFGSILVTLLMVIWIKFWFFWILRYLERPFYGVTYHFGILKRCRLRYPEEKIQIRTLFLGIGPPIPRIQGLIAPKIEATIKNWFDHLKVELWGFPKWCDTCVFDGKGDPLLQFQNWSIFTKIQLSRKNPLKGGVLNIFRTCKASKGIHLGPLSPFLPS